MNQMTLKIDVVASSCLFRGLNVETIVVFEHFTLLGMHNIGLHLWWLSEHKLIYICTAVRLFDVLHSVS